MDYRTKHQPLSQNFGSVGEVDYCVGCKTDQGVLNVEWPCDVIKVLNLQDRQDQTCRPLIQPDHIKGSEISASATSDVLPTNECDHIDGGEIPEWERNVWVWFTYCPMCGEKL